MAARTPRESCADVPSRRGMQNSIFVNFLLQFILHRLELG